MLRIIVASLLCVASIAAAPDDPPAARKPKAAFFPLGGGAVAKLREQVAFAFRQKLDRDGHYEVIDGYKMKDVAADAKAEINFDTPADSIRELGREVDATVMVWGDMDESNRLRVRILDLREHEPQPREMDKTIKAATDLRFATEQILETLPGVAPFEHPSEVALTDDALSRELWAKNPNLLSDGDFATAGHWNAMLESEYYPAPISDALPAVNKVCIYRLPDENGVPSDGPGPHHVLAMKLSKSCAESNGLACLSDPFKIEPNTRYRISFRYMSDGPHLHVFVKGYTTGQNIKGESAPREIYRRQVPPSGGTAGKWKTVIDDMNPQQIAFPVETIRVDLYAYLEPGTVMFDNVVVKAIGPQRH